MSGDVDDEWGNDVTEKVKAARAWFDAWLARTGAQEDAQEAAGADLSASGAESDHGGRGDGEGLG